jgi:hypothetical protein
MIPDSQLDELLALAEKAPAGPYKAYQDRLPEEGSFWCADAPKHSLYYGEYKENGGDEHAAKWIAACSPEAIRALVQEVKGIREASRQIVLDYRDMVLSADDPTDG